MHRTQNRAWTVIYAAKGDQKWNPALEPDWQIANFYGRNSKKLSVFARLAKATTNSRTCAMTEPVRQL